MSTKKIPPCATATACSAWQIHSGCTKKWACPTRLYDCALAQIVFPLKENIASNGGLAKGRGWFVQPLFELALPGGGCKRVQWEK